jgi:hypothetical protein
VAILRVLSCDNCGRLGDRAVHSGTEVRKADNAGTIRRTKLLKFRRRHEDGVYAPGFTRIMPVALDLCAACRDPQTVGMLRAKRTAALTDQGYEVIE